MSELYKRMMKGKDYRLIYKINQNIKISVKTPVGESKTSDDGLDIAGQGTVEGAIISANSLDSAVADEFGVSEDDSEAEDETGESDKDTEPVNFLCPILFQDDIAKVSETISDAMNANDKIIKIDESKLLTLNFEKSS